MIRTASITRKVMEFQLPWDPRWSAAPNIKSPNRYYSAVDRSISTFCRLHTGWARAVFVKFSLGGGQSLDWLWPVALEAFQKWGAQISAQSAGKFFLLCLPPLSDFFVVPPMTEQSAGCSNKDWAWGWAELADRIRGQSDLWLFSHAVSTVT